MAESLIYFSGKDFMSINLLTLNPEQLTWPLWDREFVDEVLRCAAAKVVTPHFKWGQTKDLLGEISWVQV